MIWIDFMLAAPIELNTCIVLPTGKLSNVINYMDYVQSPLSSIFPPGTAKFNPSDEVYCLPSNEIGKKDIYIPIILNKATSRTISISRHDFVTGWATIKEHAGKDIQRATENNHAKEGVEYFVPIQKLGAYKINKIDSKQGVLGDDLDNKQAFVFTCPNATILPVSAKDYCTGDKEFLQLQVMGVPPFDVYYTEKSDGMQEHQLELNRIQPEHFQSPL